MKCIICSAECFNKQYCFNHNLALKSLKKGYIKWYNAFSSNISWDEYLSRLLKIEDTGIWIMDIINYELEKK